MLQDVQQKCYKCIVMVTIGTPNRYHYNTFVAFWERSVCRRNRMVNIFYWEMWECLVNIVVFLHYMIQRRCKMLMIIIGKRGMFSQYCGWSH